MPKKLSYIHPKIELAVATGPDQKWTRIPQYTCRETVIHMLWMSLLNGFAGKDLDLSAIDIKIHYPIPNYKTTSEYEKTYLLSHLPESSPPSRAINRLVQNVPLQRRFLDLSSLCAMVPAVA